MALSEKCFIGQNGNDLSLFTTKTKEAGDVLDRSFTGGPIPENIFIRSLV